jgi:hypothetical protein
MLECIGHSQRAPPVPTHNRSKEGPLFLPILNHCSYSSDYFEAGLIPLLYWWEE